MGRMQKAIEEYHTRKNKNTGCFTVTDLCELMELSNGNSYEIMQNSLWAAYIIGYRTAKREKSKLLSILISIVLINFQDCFRP